MLEKVRLTILLFSTLIVTYGLVAGLMERVSAGDEAYKDLSVFTKVLDHVRQDYVEEPDMKRALNGALHGMMEALDPFSSFVDSETYAALTNRESAADVGLRLSKRYGYAHVVSVVESSPADQNGLRTGDLIESIDGKPTVLMSLWEAQRSLAGAADSQVTVRVIRSRRSEPQEIRLPRKVPADQEATARLVRNNIGLLRIPEFYKGVDSAVEAKAKLLISSGAEGLLIDLRSTSGGDLRAAAAAADLLLSSGLKIAEVRSQKASSESFVSTGESLSRDLPIVLLVDGGTSGPAELFAAALKDNEVAEIVGEKTNGHGSIQQDFKLHDGSVLFISTGMVYRPHGEPWQTDEIRKSGIIPDVQSPARDFVSNFYFENSSDSEDVDGLDEEFYSRLDQAIKSEQLEAALKHLADLISRSSNKGERKAA